MIAPELPLDLLDSILDNLLDDPKSLRQCSRVSKSFLIPCRKRLFSTIALNSFDWSWLAFSECIEANTYLTSFIRRLRVSWVVTKAVLPAFYKVMENIAEQSPIQQLTITITLRRSHTWSDSNTPWKRALLALLKCRNLAFLSIHLTDFSLPLEILEHISPDLKVLKLSGAKSPWATQSGEVSEVAPICYGSSSLLSLEVDEGVSTYKLAEFLTGPRCPFKINRLRSIKLRICGAGYIEALNRLLDMAGVHIETLFLTDGCFCDPRYPLNIGGLQKLRTLGVMAHEFDDPITELAQALDATHPLPESVEQLVFLFPYDTFQTAFLSDQCWMDHDGNAISISPAAVLKGKLGTDDVYSRSAIS